LSRLLMSCVTGSLDRKWLLLGLTALVAASGVIIALASSFPVDMLGRVLIGVVIGGFWSMSAATAIRLGPQRQVPRALA
ncbi:MFS transporter, partial [Klebsiella pneumoniae]|nr:MFS transporter [Klebsiella pneumoniae]